MGNIEIIVYDFVSVRIISLDETQCYLLERNRALAETVVKFDVFFCLKMCNILYALYPIQEIPTYL